VNNNEHHPALRGRFVIVAPSINVPTYLLTYLLTNHHWLEPGHWVIRSGHVVAPGPG